MELPQSESRNLPLPWSAVVRLSFDAREPTTTFSIRRTSSSSSLAISSSSSTSSSSCSSASSASVGTCSTAFNEVDFAPVEDSASDYYETDDEFAIIEEQVDEEGLDGNHLAAATAAAAGGGESWTDWDDSYLDELDVEYCCTENKYSKFIRVFQQDECSWSRKLPHATRQRRTRKNKVKQKRNLLHKMAKGQTKRPTARQLRRVIHQALINEYYRATHVELCNSPNRVFIYTTSAKLDFRQIRMLLKSRPSSKLPTIKRSGFYGSPMKCSKLADRAEHAVMQGQNSFKFNVVRIHHIAAETVCAKRFNAHILSGRDYRLVWHGTSAANAKGIIDRGLLAGGTDGIRVRNGRAHGAGVYAGINARLPLNYSDGTMFICALFRAGGSGVEARYISDFVVANTAYIVPVFRLSILLNSSTGLKNIAPWSTELAAIGMQGMNKLPKGSRVENALRLMVAAQTIRLPDGSRCRAKVWLRQSRKQRKQQRPKQQQPKQPKQNPSHRRQLRELAMRKVRRQRARTNARMGKQALR